MNDSAVDTENLDDLADSPAKGATMRSVPLNDEEIETCPSSDLQEISVAPSENIDPKRIVYSLEEL